MPLVILATLAVIASQAVISGAFSVARQSVQMGFLPRMLIVHTSGRSRGQIYVPFTNWTSASRWWPWCWASRAPPTWRRLRHRRHRHDADRHHPGGLRDGPAVALAPAGGGPGGGAFLLVDIAFFAANVIKIPGAGSPIVMGLISFTVLTTWRRGPQAGAPRARQAGHPDVGLPAGDRRRHPPGQRHRGVHDEFEGKACPPCCTTSKHNQILHERVALVTVETTDTPYVNDFDRLYLPRMEKGFMRIVIRYGFMEDPDIPSPSGTASASANPSR